VIDSHFDSHRDRVRTISRLRYCGLHAAVGALQDRVYVLESFDPRKLLALLEKIQPEATAAIEKPNEDLEDSRSGKQ
jgi:hypothetical protein